MKHPKLPNLKTVVISGVENITPDKVDRRVDGLRQQLLRDCPPPCRSGWVRVLPLTEAHAYEAAMREAMRREAAQLGGTAHPVPRDPLAFEVRYGCADGHQHSERFAVRILQYLPS